MTYYPFENAGAPGFTNTTLPQYQVGIVTPELFSGQLPSSLVLSPSSGSLSIVAFEAYLTTMLNGVASRSDCQSISVTKYGFDASADVVGASFYAADNVQPGGWNFVNVDTSGYSSSGNGSTTMPQNTTMTFLINLGGVPSGTTTVTTSIVSGNPSITVSSGSTLTFTTGNWSTHQNLVFSYPSSPANTGAAVVSVTCSDPAYLVPIPFTIIGA